ncbi:hypothetical protein ACFL2A_00675 [Thermodesulfobacteriota bacterium]
MQKFLYILYMVKYNIFMMNFISKLSISLLILTTIISCSANTNVKKTMTYDELLENNTNTAKTYDTLETKLVATATHMDAEFIESQTRKKAKNLLYDDETLSNMLMKAKISNSYFENFLVALYTPDDRFTDFSKGKGIWKFYVQMENSQLVEAELVKKVPRAKIAEYEILYPYISSWMQTYELNFLRLDMAEKKLNRPFSLIITSQLCKLEIKFN